MHLIIITPRFAPVICGVGDHSLHLAELWMGDGYRVTVVHRDLQQQGQWKTWNRETEIKRGSLTGVLRRLQQQSEAGVLLWQYVPNSYHVKAIPFYLPLVMARLKRKGWRQAVFFHEVSVRLWGYGPGSFFLAFAQRVIANAMVLVANARLTSLQLYRSYFFWKIPGLVPISANILPLVDFIPKSGTKNGRLPVVVCFANRADGPLIRAMANINQEQPCSLLLLGKCSANQEQRIRNWASEAGLMEFTISGEQDSEAISKALSEAAIFIQPQPVERGKEGGASAKNGSLAAAMAQGLPIITTCGDMTDITLFRDGENMLFVNYGNEAEYREQISSLLLHLKVAGDLGLKARQTYNKKMAWKITGQAILQAILASKLPN